MKHDGTLIVARYPAVSSIVRPRTHDRHTGRTLISWQRPLTAVLLAAGLTLAAFSPAGAELPVIDNSNLVQQIKGYLQDLKATPHSFSSSSRRCSRSSG